MNKINRRFFNIAREISKLSDFNGAKLGAVVVEGRQVISTGYNSNSISNVQRRYNQYRNFDANAYPARVHAEVNALHSIMTKRSINWNNVSIYVYREANGHRACSKPCCACSKLIKDLGIRNIYYIDEQGNYCKERVL